MLRGLIFGFCLFVGGLLCLPLRAQLTVTGSGGAFGGGAAAFQGAGDIVSGAYGYWGLDCYTSAYTGNVADIYAPTDATHTLLTCSTGGVINETLQALSTTCAISCTVKTLYDQSGNTNCNNAGAVVCDATQATIGSRPTYLISGCTGSTKNCMACSGTQGLSTFNQASNPAQPYTISTAANRNAATTSYGMILALADFSFQVGWANSANTVFSYAGSVPTVGSVADSSFHALQYVMNGASSDLNVDGTPNTVNPGTNGITSQPLGICSPAGNSFTGQFREVGLWLSAFSTGNSSAMSTNQHTRGGF